MKSKSKQKGFNHLKLVKSIALVDLSLINLEESTQSRTGFHQKTLDDFKEVWEAGGKFPPVDLYFDGEIYWVGDGFHRLKSRLAANLKGNKIEAIVYNGSKRDAILHSVGANSQHGLRRTNEDKRHAVELLLRDEEWSKWSNREIARKACVSEFLVRTIQESMCDLNPDRSTERLVERKGTIYIQKLKAGSSSSQSTSPSKKDTLPKKVDQNIKTLNSTVLELRQTIGELQEENLKKDQRAEIFEGVNQYLLNQNQSLQQEIEILKQKDRERQSWVALFNSPYVSLAPSNSPIEIQVGDETFRLVRNQMI
jgi:hypothetical protein